MIFSERAYEQSLVKYVFPAELSCILDRTQYRSAEPEPVGSVWTMLAARGAAGGGRRAAGGGGRCRLPSASVVVFIILKHVVVLSRIFKLFEVLNKQNDMLWEWIRIQLEVNTTTPCTRFYIMWTTETFPSKTWFIHLATQGLFYYKAQIIQYLEIYSSCLHLHYNKWRVINITCKTFSHASSKATNLEQQTLQKSLWFWPNHQTDVFPHLGNTCRVIKAQNAQTKDTLNLQPRKAKKIQKRENILYPKHLDVFICIKILGLGRWAQCTDLEHAVCDSVAGHGDGREQRGEDLVARLVGEVGCFALGLRARWLFLGVQSVVFCNFVEEDISTDSNRHSLIGKCVKWK